MLPVLSLNFCKEILVLSTRYVSMQAADLGLQLILFKAGLSLKDR